MPSMAMVPFRSRLRGAMDLVLGKDLEPNLASGLLAAIYPTTQGEPPKRGSAELLEAYNTMPWLRAVTSKVAVAVGSTTWRLFGTKRVNGTSRFYRDRALQQAGSYDQRRKLFVQRKQAGELVEVEESPALDLIHNANPYHVGVAARRILQVYLDLTGEFFQLLERGAMGVPIAYWPMPGTWIKELPTPRHPFFMIAIPGSGEDFPVPMTEMIWASDIDPVNPYGRGSSLSRTLSDELESSEYASKHVKATFFNRARPDFLAQVVPAPGEDAVPLSTLRRMQQRWMQEHQGFWRAFKPHFVNREIKIHEFEQDFQKQSLVPIMEYERDTIIQVFGFPPEVFGILESSNRATIDAADYLFSKYAVEPRLEFLREVWQERLIPQYDDRLILEYDSPVAQDDAHILNVMKAAPWAFQVDEIRDLADHDPLDEEKGTVYGVPISINLQEELLMEDTDADPPPEGSAAASVGGTDDDTSRSASVSKQQDDPMFVLIHAIADKLEPRLRRGFIRAVKDAKSKISVGFIERQLVSRNIVAIVAALPWDALTESLGETATTTIRQALTGVGGPTATIASDLLGVEIGFSIESPAAVEWLGSYLPRFLEGVENVSRDAIAKQLARAFDAEEGFAPSELARRIKRSIGLTDRQLIGMERFEARLIAQEVSPAQIEVRVNRMVQAKIRQRAITIARTETIRAANQGQKLVWEQAVRDGHVTRTAVKQRWMVTPDDRLDEETCEPMEGQLVGLNESFVTGTGSGVEGPPAHPRCRCGVAVEIHRR